MADLVHTRLRVTGTVQGVGFRPFVYRHAVALGLAGFVLNDSAGVLIDVSGDADHVAELARLLVDDAPPLARVTAVTSEPLAASANQDGFRIVESVDGGAPDVPVSIDSATCDACLAEVDDPADRRAGYPFTNCTNCGPRYTIVLSVPYDRPATTMARFAMCTGLPGRVRRSRRPALPRAAQRLPALRADVGLAHARRPGAWRKARPPSTPPSPRSCGRERSWPSRASAATTWPSMRPTRRPSPSCGAASSATTSRSPSWWPRSTLPSSCATLDPAARDAARLAAAGRSCSLRAAPEHGVAAAVAPGLAELGLFLPYTPLHHLLLARVGRPLVMTSGNYSDEPIAHTDDDAVARLGPLADRLVTHNRPIHIRCDDSVVRSTPARLQVLRRSRGYAPEPLPLPYPAARQVLAVGAELKSTISVAKGSVVVPSHHIGDLEHLANHRAFLQAIDHLGDLYGVTPEVVAHDLHPEYLSTKLAGELGLPTVGVQHHHAHVAACMVEHGRTAPVLGLAFDGLGYGPDGTLWGGEVLVADLTGFERVGHLVSVPMPGGVAAIREPWRMAAVWVSRASGRAAVDRALPGLDRRARDVVLDLAERGPSPTTTSIGRLFDAVAALLGGRRRVSYEAQAAIELEALARTVDRADAPTYPNTVTVSASRQRTRPPRSLGPGRTAARRARPRCPTALIAAGFHEAIGRAGAALAAEQARANGLDAVVLTGGVFQNARLTEVVEAALLAEGLRVLVHSAVPPNDGGISVGQAAIAAHP